MVSKAETIDSPSDRMKLISVAALIVGGLILFYLLSDFSFLYRVLGLLVVFGIAVFLFLQTGRGTRTLSFFKDSRTEVRKVIWPTRAETTQLTITVMIIVFLVGLFLWLLDTMLSGAFRFITGLGG